MPKYMENWGSDPEGGHREKRYSNGNGQINIRALSDEELATWPISFLFAESRRARGERRWRDVARLCTTIMEHPEYRGGAPTPLILAHALQMIGQHDTAAAVCVGALENLDTHEATPEVAALRKKFRKRLRHLSAV